MNRQSLSTGRDDSPSRQECGSKADDRAGPLGLPFLFIAASLLLAVSAQANPELMEQHCGKCHNDDEMKGDFTLTHLGIAPTGDNVFFWEDSLDFVNTDEMPPPEKSELSAPERALIVEYLEKQVRSFHEGSKEPQRSKPRRLNNRELKNSVADVLLIEHVGTHQPTANLLGDSLHHGFDTHGESLGFSQFHMEQYIEAMRKVVDAHIFSGERPKTRRIEVPTENFKLTSINQRVRAERANRTSESIEILDIRLRAFFDNFETVKTSGRYRITLRAAGIDRNYYDSEATGIYEGDPITIRAHLGDRNIDFPLPDGEIGEIVIDEWLAAGTKPQFSHHTDGLRLVGNGNFKFQYRIARDHIYKHDRAFYDKVVREEVPVAQSRRDAPDHWFHWTGYWRGPRPRLFDAEIEGPIYESWPPKRQIALLGANPKANNAEGILRPIAERAWRREVRDGELDPIVSLVQSNAKNIGDIEAFKEGIVAILVSPSFLLINPEESIPADRFATKLSYFLESTTPTLAVLKASRNREMDTYSAVLAEVQKRFDSGAADEFLEKFPYSWLQLDRINFMSPDPEHYPLYDKKRLNEDMVNEALAFFRHAIENNVPVPELLTADYSFVNADLAKVYGISGIPRDSKLRKHTFKDGRRGGILGMGAFLTLTADSLGTSPIHRAIYVMENLLGVHPNPPPADVEIEEPDVRQAKTIKEILAAHVEDETCASCHRSIDPYGYAFENFDPVGTWRKEYTMQVEERPSRAVLKEIEAEDVRRAAKGLPPVAKPWENEPIAVDSSAAFRNGSEYQDIVEYRELMKSDTNRDRFVRNFIVKLLTYANGEEPKNYWEIEKILQKSAERDYRIVDTIAAVIDSPLFREVSASDGQLLADND